MEVERRSIDVVPDAERHGSLRSRIDRNAFGAAPSGDAFGARRVTLWFGANMQITAVVVGALALGDGSRRRRRGG